MMMLTKQEYREIGKKVGFDWGGQIMQGIHSFQAGNYRDGFTEILIDEAGLHNGDLQFMIEHKMTLTKAEAIKRSKAFCKLHKLEFYNHD